MFPAIYVCPFSWLKRDNLCYLVRYDVLPWLGARKECRDVGGDLVTMNDKDTLDYIAGSRPFPTMHNYNEVQICVVVF